MKAGLRVAPGLALPLKAATETFAILAVRRAGKSNAAVVMAEEMYDAGIPWVAVDPKGDWWGIRAAGDGNKPGLSVLVFGGLHGDVPLEPTAGKLVADLIAEQHLTCVLDVSEMSRADQRRFLTDFAIRLYTKNREPLHVFLEEADEYIPQRVDRGSEKMVGAFERLVKRGGFRGVGSTMVTQRSASLNKDVLTQAGTLIAMRTPSPQDRKAVLAWIDYHAESKTVIDDLPSLADGEAWIFSPQFLQDMKRIKFRKRRTFDSGSTPEVGVERREPTRLADVDLAEIKEQMAETIERAMLDDPAHLRKRITQLERDLRTAQTEQIMPPTPEPIEVKVEVVPPQVRDILEDLEGFVERVVTEAKDRVTLALQAVERYERASESKPRPVPTPAPRSEPRRPAPRAQPAAAVEGQLRLGKTERNILTVCAQFGPRTHQQLALQTGYSAKASTISVAAGKLRKVGYLTPGQPYTITEEGLAALGSYDELPTGEELLDYWRNYFGLTERRILDVFVEVYPRDTNQQEVADMTDYSPTASTISVALGKLRRVGVIDGWRASDDFMKAVGRG